MSWVDIATFSADHPGYATGREIHVEGKAPRYFRVICRDESARDEISRRRDELLELWVTRGWLLSTEPEHYAGIEFIARGSDVNRTGFPGFGCRGAGRGDRSGAAPARLTRQQRIGNGGSGAAGMNQQKLSKPVEYLRWAGGWYTATELAGRVNMPRVDVISALEYAKDHDLVTFREHRGDRQFRWING